MIGSKPVVRPTKVKNFLRKSYDRHNAANAHGNYVMKQRPPKSPRHEGILVATRVISPFHLSAVIQFEFILGSIIVHAEKMASPLLVGSMPLATDRIAAVLTAGPKSHWHRSPKCR
jgi:hypothetical protein